MSIGRTRTRRLRGSRHLVIVRMVIALLAVAVGWIIAAPGALAASTSVNIGVVLPLSGSSAAAGQAAEHGAQLAVQEANSGKLVSGVTFSIVSKSDTDAAGAPNGADGATQIKGLIGSGRIAGVVAPFDTVTALGELPLANRAPLATVSPTATDTCLTISGALGCTGSAAELSTVRPTGNTTFFRVAPSDALQGAALADFLFKERGYRRAYVIDDTSAAGMGQAATFESEFVRESGAVVGHASVAPG
jgi:branched-chain amino acid transport system substrate-binding protein